MYKIFQGFVGKWKLSRQITGLYFGKKYDNLTMNGTATFSKKDDTLLYQEVVKMWIESHKSLDGTQNYQYVWKDKKIQVLFADGRLFHELKNGAEHQCGKDLYTTYYTFTNANRFEVKHVVQGPKKSYVSNTTFEKNPV